LAGKPLPDEPASREVDRDRARRLAEAHARAERHDELVALAEGVTRAEAEEALSYMQLEEADESGALRFELTDAVRAAATLLRESNEERETLRQLRAEVAANRAALDEIANQSSGVDLAENRSVYETVDSHGSTLLCIDFPIKTNPHK
jgi:hypothetical protein